MSRLLPRQLVWLAVLCLIGSTFVISAAAQGSASTGSQRCTLGVWMTTSAPEVGFDVVYPNNSVAYERHNYTLPAETFFIANWYVGIILIVVAVFGAYILLALWICYHFDFLNQHRAKKVVEESYKTNGYFDLDRYKEGGSKDAELDAERRSDTRSVRSFRESGGSQGEDYYDDSYSDDYGSDSPTLSEEVEIDADTNVFMNPLRPRS